MSKGRGFNPVRVRTPGDLKGKKAPMDADADDEPEEEQMFPDYGFPIVYHFINHEEYTHMPTLNDYIVMQTNACNRMSRPYGVIPGQYMPRFLSSASEVCVLFMHWDASSHLDALQTAEDKSTYYDTLNDVLFLNKCVLGHAKFLSSPPYLAIYNFCKHGLTVTVQGEITERAIPFGPIGFAMFTALLTAAQLMPGINPSSTLWLAIDLANPLFTKVANIYTVSGFSNPIITNTDVTGAQLPFTILQLTRPLHAHVSRHLESVNNFNQVMNLVHNWNESVVALPNAVVNFAGYNARIMMYRFSFDRACIMSLRLFPYVSFNAQGSAISVTQMDAQRETSGKFVSIKSVHNPDDHENSHDVLALETTVVSSDATMLRYTVGTASSVQMEYGEATFHTHPVINYRAGGISIAPPSSPDFLAFVNSFIFFQSPGQIQHHQSFKFSLVSTVEGLYIISLSPSGISYFTDMMTRYPSHAAFNAEAKKVTDTYEYHPSKRKLIWQVRTFEEFRSQDALYAHIHAYTDWFNEINRANLFELKVITWDEFNSQDKIAVYYLENRINLP